MRRILILMHTFAIWTVSAFGATPQSTLHPEIVPLPLIKAMQEVHGTAAQASLKSLFMYKYVYFDAGFCKDQDCSAEAQKIYSTF
jgi:hypothetical protein